MPKQKVCRKCKIFTDESVCPTCGGSNLTETWKGKLIVLKPEQSEIAKKMKIEKEGTYAIKTG